MKQIFFAIFFATFFYGFSQDFNYNTDFASTLKETKKKKSEIYYPNLLERFQANNPKLTNKEVLALMIGSTNSSSYKPYELVESERNIIKLIQSEKYQEALALCDQLLSSNPVNFTALMERGYASMKLNLEEADEDRQRFFLLFDAIKSTGTGSQEDPYFVLGPRDGQLIINYIWGQKIGTMGSGDCEGKNFCDILEMIDESGKSRSVYFNIQHAVDRMF